jgi:hypothetical protein
LSGADFGGELFLPLAHLPEVPRYLQTVPRFGGLAKKGAKDDRLEGRDPEFPKDVLVDLAG